MLLLQLALGSLHVLVLQDIQISVLWALEAEGAVFRIHIILMWIRIRGSMPLRMDPNSDQDEDPDPRIFVIDFQEANKKLNFFKNNFSAYYFLKVHLNHFSKIKKK